MACRSSRSRIRGTATAPNSPRESAATLPSAISNTHGDSASKSNVRQTESGGTGRLSALVIDVQVVPTVVACLGDSITEGSPYWDSRRRAGDPEGQWEHWAGLLHPELDFRNFGIWGERTDEIAARFETAAADAEVLIVQGGINDIAQGHPI